MERIIPTKEELLDILEEIKQEYSEKEKAKQKDNT